jgi:hypothetical protein
LSTLLAHPAYPCYMIHVHVYVCVTMLHVHVLCPCCVLCFMYKLHVHAACPCLHAACPFCTICPCCILCCVLC